MDARLPKHDDFVTHGCLDDESAFRKFGGKSVEQVRDLLEDNYLYYQEPFMWMGAVAFCFYIDAMLGYIKSQTFDRKLPDFEFIVDEARMFISICEFRIDNNDKSGMAPCADKIAAVLEWLTVQLSELDEDLASRAVRMRDAYFTLADDI